MTIHPLPTQPTEPVDVDAAALNPALRVLDAASKHLDSRHAATVLGDRILAGDLAVDDLDLAIDLLAGVRTRLSEAVRAECRQVEGRAPAADLTVNADGWPL